MSLPHAILASLDFSPMTGYDLKKFIDQSAGHFWTTTQSHIYTALESLEKKGWAEKTIIPQEDKPNRKEYNITAAGLDELKRWLVTPLPPAPVREAWLIQLFFSHHSSDADIKNLLLARKENIKAVLAGDVGTGEPPAEDQVPPELKRAAALWQLTRSYGNAFYRFELEQLDRLISELENLPPR